MKNRPNLVLAVVAAVAIVLAVVAWVFSASQSSVDADPSTPEGTVQIYVKALAENDDETVVSLLDPRLGCEVPLGTGYISNPVSLTLVSSKIDGDKAVVAFEVTEQGDSIYDTWSHREVFNLVRKDSGWMLTEEPWPVYTCK